MTIDSVNRYIKLFFLNALLMIWMGISSSYAQDTITIYNFDEMQELHSDALDKTYLGQLAQNLNPAQPLNVDTVVQAILMDLKTNLTDFKNKDPSWTGADTLLKQLNSPKETQYLQGKVRQMLITSLINALEHDPKNSIDVYFTIPRIIVDFREKLNDALDVLEPSIRDSILKRLNRDIFKEGKKNGYIKDLSTRYNVTFPAAKAGEKSLLGLPYPPGMTYFSQSYMVLAEFSLLDNPLYIFSSVLFKFLTQTTEFKEPFGLITRDLKRLLPRKLDAFRETIQSRLMRLYDSLDPNAKIYLIQQFLPTSELDSMSYLEFYGHGFPVYQDNKKNIVYSDKKQLIFLESGELLSPIAYRKAFVEKDGNPQRFHTAPGLPTPKSYKTPIYPLRLSFNITHYSDYIAFTFSGEKIDVYEKELQAIVDDLIKILTQESALSKKPEVAPQIKKPLPAKITSQQPIIGRSGAETSGGEGLKKAETAKVNQDFTEIDENGQTTEGLKKDKTAGKESNNAAQNTAQELANEGSNALSNIIQQVISGRR